MANELLPAIEIETGPNPNASVIWLHGLGDDGHGWSEVVPALKLRSPTRFLFPHAPVMPVTINQGMQMRAWYDINLGDLNQRADIGGVRRSQQQVQALMARERTRGVAADRIVLAGFSQGGAIALYTALREGERLAGIVALSTYVIDGPSLAREASAANRDIPIFMAHGRYDPMIQLRYAELSKQVLESAGYKVEFHVYPMEHSAMPEEIDAVSDFLARILDR
jgi:phospholipase/carboxylesterase